MKDSKAIKKYYHRLLSIANKFSRIINALLAQKQRRFLTSGRFVEGALPIRVKETKKRKTQVLILLKSMAKQNLFFSPCKHCGKKGHPPFKCWKIPDQKCEKCLKTGYHQKIRKSNFQQK
ncbi:Retrovirus-related Pol polyprotein from transposon TNT 1-94 [Gossypium australe]|uniref:Retrovirus-related Pol polyprotein from transposon TNT 1-94 n=1 Tax=Gossypium australe TaxID=47621 RepID=A0A5B6VEI0_9ROSI|nr:Retrovirus-related Pol polyprotein from transposon TNT 1-94 [Gossypium australe]